MLFPHLSHPWAPKSAEASPHPRPPSWGHLSHHPPGLGASRPLSGVKRRHEESYLQGALPQDLANPPTGTEECERALMGFVAFQKVSFRRLLQLKQALSGLGAWVPCQPWEDCEPCSRHCGGSTRSSTRPGQGCWWQGCCRPRAQPGCRGWNTVHKRFSLAG